MNLEVWSKILRFGIIFCGLVEIFEIWKNFVFFLRFGRIFLSLYTSDAKLVTNFIFITQDGEHGAMMSPSTAHPFVARGDLQEDVWLGLYSGDGRRGREGGGREEGGGEKEGESQICVINFKGKASFSTQVS